MLFSKYFKYLTFLIISLPLLSGGCALFRVRSERVLPTVPASMLLLDVQSFPKGWKIEPCEPYCADNLGKAKASRTFVRSEHSAGETINQDVFRFRSNDDAQQKFRLYRDTWFQKMPPPQTPSSAFAPPEEVTYRSPLADEYYFACGVQIIPLCRLIARYDTYFIYMVFQVDSGWVDGEHITSVGIRIQDIEPILEALDARIRIEMNISMPTPTMTER